MNYNFLSGMTSLIQLNLMSLIVGYRFHPTDDELIDHHLKPKLLGHFGDVPPIPEIKVCDLEPWDIPALVNTNSEDQVWYFFCPRDYKYSRSCRSNRTTNAGYWKPTGKPRKVKAKRTKEEIGTKRSLVFYIKDEPKPRRTKWIMHEYECIPNSTLAAQGNFLLCKLKLKSNETISKGEPSHVVSAPGIPNQNSNVIVVSSSVDECEPSIPLDFDFENDNLTSMTAMSTYDKGSKKNPTGDSTGDEVESCYYLGSVGETQNPNEVTAMSTCETMDFGNQNPSQMTDISASANYEVGELSYTAIPSEKTNISTDSIPADLENNTAETALFEVYPLEAFYNDDLEALLELEDNLIAALFPPMSIDESLTCSRFDTSVTGG